MAGRNNPLIKLLGITFDTFNLLHRWFGRIVLLEALAHTFAYLASSAATKGWGASLQTVLRVPYMTFGFIVCLTTICCIICTSERLTYFPGYLHVRGHQHSGRRPCQARLLRNL
jgi:hypothetical protein